MKRSALLNLVLFTVVLSIGAVGCKSGPTSLTPIPGQGGYDPDPGGINDGFANEGEDVFGIPQSEAAQKTFIDGIPDPEFFSANTVYFEFDSSAVSPGDIGNIEAVAAHLNSNPSDVVLVEGHCDDRGTEEYNRALGERRALSVREILVTQMGILADRVTTLSYGEDIPAVDGQNSEAWAKNRRGEFILVRPKN